MSQTVGPIAVTPATTQRIQVDAAAVACALKNDSPYHVYIAPGPVGPTDGNPASQQTTAYPSDFPAWSGGEIQLPAPGSHPPFDGALYLYCAPLAGMTQAAQTQGRNDVTITSYRQGEPVIITPSGRAMPDPTNLARVIALSPAAQSVYTAVWNPGAGALDFSPVIWTRSTQSPPGLSGFGFFVAVYIDYLDMFLAPGGTAGQLEWQFQVVTKDGGGVVLQTYVLGTFMMGIAASGAIMQYSQPRPRGILILPQVTPTVAQTAVLRFAAPIAWTTTSGLIVNMGADCDWWNQAVPPYVGGGFAGRVPMVTQVPPGIVPNYPGEVW